MIPYIRIGVRNPYHNTYLKGKYTHTCINNIDMMQIDLSTSQHPGPPYLRPSETQPNYIFLNYKIYLCDESENVFVYSGPPYLRPSETQPTE